MSYGNLTLMHENFSVEQFLLDYQSQKHPLWTLWRLKMFPKEETTRPFFGEFSTLWKYRKSLNFLLTTNLKYEITAS